MKKTLIGLVIIQSLLSSLVFAQPSNESFPVGGFRITISERPSQPYGVIQNYNTALTRQGLGSGFPVAVSRHHIIPFNMLRDFYNRVTEYRLWPRSNGFLNSFSNNLRFYAGSNSMDCGVNSFALDLLNAGDLASSMASGLAVNDENGGIAPGFATFEECYAWLPGNLFIGPNNRSDDPHEGFEVNAGEIIGARRYQLLLSLYNNIHSFLHNPNPTSQQSITELQHIVNQLSMVAKWKNIQPLNPQDWEYVHGKFRIKKHVQLENRYKSYTEYALIKNNSPMDICEKLVPNFKKRVFFATVRDD